MKWLFFAQLSLFVFLFQAPQLLSEDKNAEPDQDYQESFKSAQKECAAKGGKYGRFGVFGYHICNTPTRDARRACTSSTQCQSLCVSKELLPKGRRATGKCYEWNIPRKECFSKIEAGVSQGSSCAE